MILSGSLTFIIVIGIIALFFIVERIIIAVERVRLAKYKSERSKCVMRNDEDDIDGVVNVTKEVK